MNLANHCGTFFSSYPALLSCPTVGSDIQYCQSQGKKVLISLGGAVGTYGFTSDQQAQGFATTIWNMFLGGTNSSYPRPFGTGVVMNGVDLDIEAGVITGYAAFVNQLRTYFATDSSNTYYVSGKIKNKKEKKKKKNKN